MNDPTPEELEKRLEALLPPTPSALDGRIARLLHEATQSEHASVAPVLSLTEKTRAQARATRLAPKILKRVAGIAAVCALGVAGWLFFARGDDLFPSAYAGLDEALQNSKAAEWAHLRATLQGETTETWMSFRPYRFFTKTGGKVTAYDSSSRRSWDYDPEKRLLTIREMTPDRPESTAASFQDLMEKSLNLLKDIPGTEVSRSERTLDGKRVVIYTASIKGDLVERYIVDPETRRVIELDGEIGDEKVRCQVDYPAQGPADVYAIGVPRDARQANWEAEVNPVNKLVISVNSAQRRFPNTYFATVCRCTVFGDGKQQLVNEEILLFKKNGGFRVERYLAWKPRDGDAIKDSQAQTPPTSYDMTSLEEWTKTRGLMDCMFYPSDLSQPETRWTVGNKSCELTRMREQNLRPCPFSVESDLWDAAGGLLTAKGIERTMLPPCEGPFGPLVVVQSTWQGMLVREFGGPQAMRPQLPRQLRTYVNPARDFIVERSEERYDFDAPWQKDKDWLKGYVFPKSEVKQFARKMTVLKYEQTEDGRYYAAEVEKSPGSYPGSTEKIYVHVDTKRQIPDTLMDAVNAPPEARFGCNQVTGSAK